MDIKELLAKIAEYDEMEAPDGMNLLENIDNPYTVQEFHSDISDAIEAFTEVQELLMEKDENFDEPSLKAIRTSERILECSKKFRADLLEQRAAKWESKNEAIGDTLRSNHTINGNPWFDEDAGTMTIEFFGLPVEYQLVRFVETDKDNGEIVEERFRIEPTEVGRKVIENDLKNVIENEFQKQAKDLYGIDIKRIGGNTMVGIPNSAEYTK